MNFTADISIALLEPSRLSERFEKETKNTHGQRNMDSGPRALRTSTLSYGGKYRLHARQRAWPPRCRPAVSRLDKEKALPKTPGSGGEPASSKVAGGRRRMSTSRARYNFLSGLAARPLRSYQYGSALFNPNEKLAGLQITPFCAPIRV